MINYFPYNKYLEKNTHSINIYYPNIFNTMEKSPTNKKYPRNFYLIITKIPHFLQILRNKHIDRISGIMDHYNLREMNIIENEIKCIQQIAILTGRDIILLNDLYSIILSLPLSDNIKMDFTIACDDLYEQLNAKIYEHKKKTLFQHLFGSCWN
jgi:hypothetical protein